MKNLFIGILLGGLVVYLFLDNKQPPAESPIAVEKVQSEPERNIAAVEKKPLKVVGKIADGVKTKKLKIYQKLKTQKQIHKTVEKKKDKKLKLNLNRFSVGLLENSWDELPDHASSERTDDGWKIRLKRKDNFFSRFGFKDGDVINYESLNNDNLTDGQSELMERVVAILQHIEE